MIAPQRSKMHIRKKKEEQNKAKVEDKQRHTKLTR